MSIKDIIEKDTLNRAFVSKSATGTQIMAGSLRLLGNITVDGTTNISALNAGAITSTGTVSATTFSGAFSGSGAAITNLNATNLATGTVNDARLSSNIFRLNTAQTVTANTTYSAAANLYFAGGTSYWISTNGSARLNALTTTGVITVDGNRIDFGSGSSRSKIRLTGTENYVIGADTSTTSLIIGGNTTTNIQTKIHANSTELIATLGGTTTAERLDTTLHGSLSVAQSLEIGGELKTGGGNEFPDPLVMSRGISSWGQTAGGSYVFDSTQSPMGLEAAGSIKIEATTTRAYMYSTKAFPTGPSEWVTFSAYAFATTSSKQGRMTIRWMDAARAEVKRDDVFQNLTTGWQRYTMSGQAPANATQFDVAITSEGLGTITYWSGFQVERGKALTPFKSYAGGKDINLFFDGSKSKLVGTGNNGITLATNGNIGINTDAPAHQIDVTGTGRVSGALTLGTAGTATTHAVRADRTITAGAGLSGGGNLTANRTLSIDTTWLNTHGDGRWVNKAGDTMSGALNVNFHGTAGVDTIYLDMQGVNGNDALNQDSGAFIRFRTSISDGYGAWIGGHRRAGGSSAMVFKTGGQNPSTTMYLDENGRLGIGTTSPSSPLHVVGAGILTGSLALGTGNASTLINQTDGALNHTNAHGYIQIGPKNTSYAHIYTDRPSFYFNKELRVNGHLVWHADNDGASSGLDADLLDGLHATSFMRSDVDTATTGILAINTDTADSLRISRTSTTANIGVRYSNTLSDIYAGAIINSASDKHFAIGASANLSTSKFIINVDTGEATINGNKVWHAGNDGVNSGLDADLLDGLNSTVFMRTNTNTSTTGTITIGSGTVSVLANQTDGSLRHSNSLGYIEIGPKNANHAHIYTDRPTFYFNKDLIVNGSGVWHAGNMGAGSGLDADKLDGLESGNFVQTSRTITAGTGLSGGGSLLADRSISFDTTWGDNRYLGKGAKAVDADRLDNLDSTQFLRSDIADTKSHLLTLSGSFKNHLRLVRDDTQNWVFTPTTRAGDSLAIMTENESSQFYFSANGNIYVGQSNKVWHQGNMGPSSGLDADTVDGVHLAGLVQTSRTLTAGTGITGGGNLTANRTLSFDTAWGDARYLGISAKANDSDKLNGLTASSYLRSNANATMSSTLTVSGKLDVTGDMDVSNSVYLSGVPGTHREGGKMNLLSRISGRLVNNNPDFMDNTMNGYSVYDNNNSGRLITSLITDDMTPGASGKLMRLSYDPARSATLATPGYGGFTLSISRDTGDQDRWGYRAGNRYVYRVIAKIPTGRNLVWTTNVTGTGGGHRWLTSRAGTNDWQEYVVIHTIGNSGSFSSTGFFYIEGGTDTAFTWDVAICQMIGIDEIPDVDRAPVLNVGYKRDVNLGWGEVYASGKISTDANVETSGNIIIKTDAGVIQSSTGGSFINLVNSSGNMHIKADERSRTLFIDSNILNIRNSAGTNQMTIGSNGDGNFVNNFTVGKNLTVAGDLTVNKTGMSSFIRFPAQTNDPGYIEHYENNNTSIMRFSVSDDATDVDCFSFGAAPSNSFIEGARITAAGNATFKGLTTTGITLNGNLNMRAGDKINLPFSAGQKDSITIGNVTIDQTLAANLVITNLQELRFGTATNTTWDHNKWGGIKYITTTDTMVIGGPASANFQSNPSPPRIAMNFEGIGTASFDGKVVINPAVSSTIGGSTMANGYLLVGTTGNGVAIDPNELYFSGDHGLIGTIGAHDLIFLPSGSEKFRVNVSGAKVTGALDVTTTVNAGGRVTATGGVSIPSGESVYVGTYGSSTASFRMHYNGTHSYLDYNGDLYLRSGTTERARISAAGNLGIKTAPHGSYGINTDSILVNNWLRSSGSSGWYSETHGGGWHMTDTTWIRAYNNKDTLLNKGRMSSLEVGTGTSLSAANDLSVTGGTLNWRNTLFSGTAGKVSINQAANTEHPLQVASSGSFQGINIHTTGDGFTNGLSFSNASHLYQWHIARDGSQGSSPDLVFFGGSNNSNMSNLAERVRFAIDGKVSIGKMNTIPQALSVVGQVQSQGFIIGLNDSTQSARASMRYTNVTDFATTRYGWTLRDESSYQRDVMFVDIASGYSEILMDADLAVGSKERASAKLHVRGTAHNGLVRFERHEAGSNNGVWDIGMPHGNFVVGPSGIPDARRDFVIRGDNGNVGIGLGGSENTRIHEKLHVGGKVKADSGFKTGSFEIVHNSSEDSLDFIYA